MSTPSPSSLTTINERIPQDAPWSGIMWWNDPECGQIARDIRQSLADSATVVASSSPTTVLPVITLACGYAQVQQHQYKVYHTSFFVEKAARTKTQRLSPQRPRASRKDTFLIAQLEPPPMDDDDDVDDVLPPVEIIEFILKCAEARSLFQQALDIIQHKRDHSILPSLYIRTRQDVDVDLAPILLTISDDPEHLLFCQDARDVLQVLIALAGNKPEFNHSGWIVRQTGCLDVETGDWEPANLKTAENLVGLLLQRYDPCDTPIIISPNDTMKHEWQLNGFETPVKQKDRLTSTSHGVPLLAPKGEQLEFFETSPAERCSKRQRLEQDFEFSSNDIVDFASS